MRKSEQRKTEKSTAAGASWVKRTPVGRIKKILRLLQEGRYPNCSSIATELEISPKTAARDLDCMRDRLEMPIDYDGKRHGFFLTRPVENLPVVPVTTKELFAVCVAHKAIEHYRGTPLAQPLELAFKKFAGQLDDEELFTLQSLEEVLSFRPFAPEDADLRKFEVVTEAVRERRVMGFEYRKPGARRAEARRVHPYHLMEFGARWYLLAHDLEREDIRTFVLGRMSNLALREESFEMPADFNPKTFFAKSLGVMAGKGDYDVVIEMDAWLTDILRGRRWHPSQEWTELPGGGSHLRMRLSCLEEIEQYVLSWGTHATVIGPTELRERLVQTAGELVRRYGGAPVRREGGAA